MRQVTKELDHGKSALFVLYEGNWSGIHRADRAGRLDRQGPPDPEHPVPREGGGAQGARRPGGRAARRRRSRGGLRGGRPRGGRRPRLPRRAGEAAPAEAAAPAPSPDDLTQLAGVGPKASAALAASGITTYAALADANEPEVRHALHAADMAPPANVGTWPMQASYAASGDWQGLMKYNKRTPSPRITRRRSPRPRPPRRTT